MRGQGKTDTLNPREEYYAEGVLKAADASKKTKEVEDPSKNAAAPKL